MSATNETARLLRSHHAARSSELSTDTLREVEHDAAMQLERCVTAVTAVGAAIAMHNTTDDVWLRHMGWAVNLLGETAEMLLDVSTDAAERLQRRKAE